MAGHDLDHQFPGPGPQPVSALAPPAETAQGSPRRMQIALAGCCAAPAAVRILSFSFPSRRRVPR
jgi:hypothetical protein